MKILACNECGEKKDEIEFEYFYFQRKYSKICNICKETKERSEKNKKKHNEASKKI